VVSDKLQNESRYLLCLLDNDINLEEIKCMECGENIIIHTVRGLIVFRSNCMVGYSDN